MTTNNTQERRSEYGGSTSSDLLEFRDAVAADVASQYPSIDYISSVVARAVERHAAILGWTWYADGPRPTPKTEAR